jgi:hypothetical protein
VRNVDLARGAVGLSVLLRPELPARLTGSAPTRTVHRLSRLLALRLLGQAGAGAVASAGPGRRRLARADALIDASHAASMLPLAVLRADHRRLALASATVALVFAAADLAGDHGGGRRHG